MGATRTRSSLEPKCLLINVIAEYGGSAVDLRDAEVQIASRIDYGKERV